MYQLINANSDAVIDAAERLGITAYTELRADLNTVDASTDLDFQGRYRSYWRMNVGRFGPKFYSGYFRLLAECQRTGSADVRRTIKSLSKLGAASRGLQFSFATKLAHTVDPRIPVYDAYVASFYFYSPLSSKKARGDRIVHLLEFHDFLKVEYRRILDERLLRKSIAAFRKRQPLSADVPDERIIDWLLWGWVSFLRSGAQQRGEAMYG